MLPKLNAASGQNYHHTFKVDAAVLDSTDVLHLQVSLRKMDSANMKFRLSAFNPATATHVDRELSVH